MAQVNPDIVLKLLNEGLVPVISTIGASLTGQAYNINADAAAGAVAAALGAEKIIYLTGAPGLLEDPADPSTLISRLSPGGAARQAGLGRDRGRHDPQAAGLRRRGRRRGAPRPTSSTGARRTWC